MVKKYHGGEVPQPSAYRLALSCNHGPIMSPQEIRNNVIDSRYTPQGSDITIMCPLCAVRAPGSCTKGNTFHHVIGMQAMYSGDYSRQVQDENEQQQQ